MHSFVKFNPKIAFVKCFTIYKNGLNPSYFHTFQKILFFSQKGLDFF